MTNLFKLMRVEQWSKNLLIFAVPLFANQFEFEIYKNLIIVFLDSLLLLLRLYY